MRTLTIRISEGKHARLRALAKARGLSVNRLMDELTMIALTEFDVETRFRAMAASGSRETGLTLLDNLDRAFSAPPGLPIR